MTFEDYVNIDSNVQTDEKLTETEILAELQRGPISVLYRDLEEEEEAALGSLLGGMDRFVDTLGVRLDILPPSFSHTSSSLPSYFILLTSFFLHSSFILLTSSFYLPSSFLPPSFLPSSLTN